MSDRTFLKQLETLSYHLRNHPSVFNVYRIPANSRLWWRSTWSYEKVRTVCGRVTVWVLLHTVCRSSDDGPSRCVFRSLPLCVEEHSFIIQSIQSRKVTNSVCISAFCWEKVVFSVVNLLLLKTDYYYLEGGIYRRSTYLVKLDG